MSKNEDDFFDISEIAQIKNISTDLLLASQEIRGLAGNSKTFKPTDWLKKPIFYHYGIIYMCTRIYNNVYNVLNMYYLVTVLGFSTLEKL